MIYTTASGEYRDLAERIAADRNERVVEDVSEVRQTDEAVIYVDEPTAISESTLLSFQKRLLSSGPETGQFSVVTGYTPEDAANLYYGDADDRDGHSLVLQPGTPDGASVDDELTVLQYGDVNTEKLSRLCSDGLESLSLMIHGWSIHLNMSEGYLCGVPSSRDVDDYDNDHPPCVQDGEIECPFDEELLRAEEVTASHLFVASCMSMIDNNLYGLPVHVGMGLLRGAKSLVGPYRLATPLPVDPVLHHVLFRAGYDLNERCYVLNRNAHVNGSMAYPYVSFGNPEASIRTPSPSRYDTHVERNGERAYVDVDAIDTPVVDFTVPLDDLPVSDGRFYVRNHTQSEDLGTVFYSAFEEGDALRVLLFTGERLTDESIRVEIVPTPSGHAERERALASLENANRLKDLGMLTGKAKKQLDSFWHQLHDLPEETENERYDADAHRETDDHLRQLFGNVDGIRDELVQSVSDGPELKDKYSGHAVDDDVYVTELDCYDCGRRVFVKQVSDGFGTRRALSLCPRCGVLYDVPVEGRTTTPHHPTITGGDSRDELRTIEVSFENPADTNARITFCPYKKNAGPAEDDVPLFDPQSKEAELGPGETATVEFTVDTQTTDRDRMQVIVMVVANLEAYTARKWLLDIA